MRLAGPIRPWLVALIAVTVLNGAFGAAALWTATADREPLRVKVRAAFADGDLTTEDYLPFDRRRGWHQYNDCNILQMMTNRDESRLGRAFSPRVYVEDASYLDVCRSLYEISHDTRPLSAYLETRYPRYWHGYVPLSTLLLRYLDLGGLRILLKSLLIAALGALALTAWISPRPLPTFVIPVSLTGMLFWAVPYFGQGLSHGLGDVTVILGLAVLLLVYPAIRGKGLLPMYCSCYGAIVVYFEMLTGPLPIAAGLLFPALYLLERGSSVADRWRVAIVGLVAFAIGAIFSVVFKQIMTVWLADPQALESFGSNLRWYTTPIGPTEGIPLVTPFSKLVRRADHLTYGVEPLAMLLLVATALAWAVAGLVALRARRTNLPSDFAAFAVGGSSVVVWVLLWQTHTTIHAAFMVRILLVPIALGWAALLWVLRSRVPLSHRTR